jgi:hypothetical protein
MICNPKLDLVLLHKLDVHSFAFSNYLNMIKEIYNMIIHVCIIFLIFLSNPYFTPDVIGEPLTNKNFSYIKVFGMYVSFINL